MNQPARTLALFVVQTVSAALALTSCGVDADAELPVMQEAFVPSTPRVPVTPVSTNVQYSPNNGYQIQPTQAAHRPAPVAASASEGDVLHMRAVDVVDRQGFGRPVTALRFLIPKDWKVEGGLQWIMNNPNEMVRIHVRCTSPDGEAAFEIFPSHVWHYTRDRTMQQSFSMQGIHFGVPLDALSTIEQLFVPSQRRGARIVHAERVEAAARAAYERARPVVEPLVRAGQNDFRVDAGRARLEYERGSRTYEEWVTTTVSQLTMLQAVNFEATAAAGYRVREPHHITEASSILTFSAPKGQLDGHEQLFAAIVGSLQANPSWTAAVAQVQSNLSQIAINGALDRFGIITEAQRAVSNTVNNTWKNTQAGKDRSAAAFIRGIRDTALYFDPTTGMNVELTSGYDAWSNGHKEFILSARPGYNPNELPGMTYSWTRLEQPR